MRTGAPTRSELLALAKRDPVLGAAMKRVAPYPGFPDGHESPADSHFHALARAVIHQMLSGKAAATIHARVHALTPGPRFPTAEQMLALDPALLRGAGLSNAKVAAMRDLAERALSGDLPLRRITRMSDEDVLAHVTAVRGLGEWTAQMFLLFRLGRLDVLPPHDLGVQEGLKRLDGLADRPKPKQLLARAEVWRPLRSVGTWVMWRLYDVK
jgi:DNA-3-methyladenine glycosylase II